MKRFPYSDAELRDFFLYAKDPVNQVFICADLNLTDAMTMYYKLLDIGLVKPEMLPEVKEELMRRTQDEAI